MTSSGLPLSDPAGDGRLSLRSLRADLLETLSENASFLVAEKEVYQVDIRLVETLIASHSAETERERLVSLGGEGGPGRLSPGGDVARLSLGGDGERLLSLGGEGGLSVRPSLSRRVLPYVTNLKKKQNMFFEIFKIFKHLFFWTGVIGQSKIRPCIFTWCDMLFL